MKQLDPKAVWMFFLQSAFFWLFLVVFMGISSARAFVASGMPAIWPILLILGALIAISYFWAQLSWKYYRYELTPNGFRKESGVIWKRYVTIPYDRIQNVDVLRGPLARILGLSDLHIQTAGMSAGANGVAASEGRLPGISKEEADSLRDELIERAKAGRHQGL